jgi:putative MATE family efflux protein
MKQKHNLLADPIASTLFKMSVPMFFAMVGFALFNFFDTKFVGELGTDPLAALSYTVNTMLIMFALAFGLGTGVTATIAKAVGAGDDDKVVELTTHSLILAVVFAFILMVIGLPNIEVLFKFFGARDELMPYIKDYMELWYLGVPLIIIPMLGNSAIRAQGNTLIPALIMGVSILANIFLDYGLILGNFGMPRLEVFGASLATFLSRILTLIASLGFLHFKFGMISFKGFSIKGMIKSWKEVLKIGVPAIATQMIIPISVSLIAKIASDFPDGKQLVSALQTAGRVDFFALAIVAALGGVLVPFIAQNYGAGNFDRIKKAVSLSRRFALIWGIVTTILFISIRHEIGPIFMKRNPDPIFFNFMSELYWIVPYSFVFRMFFVIDTCALNAYQKPIHTGALTFFQMIILYVPLAIILGNVFGFKGIFASYLISTGIGGIASYFTQNKMFKLLIER